MKTKLLGLVSALMLFASAHAHATTIYEFDTPVVGSIVPSGTVALSVAGSTATFTVSLPTNYSFTEFALNLLPGATVNASSAYNVSLSPASFSQGKTYPVLGPFNTVLSGFSGSSLAFTVSNFAGISSDTFNGAPIWFVAAFVYNGSSTGVIAADSIQPVVTPLPGALPLFAGGLGVLGLLGRRKKRANAAALSTT